MVTSVQGSTSTAASQATSNAAQIGATQDRFLKLLVTQMKNQDPLNPMDNAQVTSQMAQLSTVTGIDKLNSTVEALSASMLASQSLSAVSMIGHPVLVAGTQIDLANSQGDAAVELTQPVDNLMVSISDTSGNVVRTLNMGAQQSGLANIQWDGRTDTGSIATDGKYSFSAVSTLGGNKSDATTLSYGMVNSVAQSQGGVTVNVGQLGEVSLNSIKKIL
ncbi:MAG: flagellar basal-body rod modification protein FlgD [Gallionellaceae bacterium]|nr:MAG: flagellar basal-body rod modification protein FlgD [Gallionellaceae bacterium]